MAGNIYKSVKNAISNLNPAEIREEADRPVQIGLHAATQPGFEALENYLVHAAPGPQSRYFERAVYRAEPGGRYDVEIYTPDIAAPPHAFTWWPANPQHTVRQILGTRPELALALARRVEPFRSVYISRTIRQIAKENGVFSIATALPDVVPMLSLPWAGGEFASDTAVLTANQIRMSFLLAAANDMPVGYREEKGEIATILMGAFGWRALARELVSKIPFGGGLLPKAAISYAGTTVVGLSLDRYYKLGQHFNRSEQREAYQRAYEKGKAIVGLVLANMRSRQQHAS